MKKFWAFFLFVFMVVFGGCTAIGGPAIREAKPESLANNPTKQAGSRVIFANSWQATHPVFYLSRGNLSRAEMMGNENGNLVVYEKYIAKIELDNAFSEQDPKKAEKLLDPDQQYTVLEIVKWGAFGKVYTIRSYAFRTTRDPVRAIYRDPRGRSEYCNVVVNAAGTDQPAVGKLRLDKIFRPGDFLKGLLQGGGK